MKRKGFIKVVEAVIASIIVLASLTYFFGYYVKASEWPNAQLKLQSQDIMNTIDKSETLEEYMMNGETEGEALQRIIQGMVSDQVGFSLDIIGAPPPVVKIVCVKCDDMDGDAKEYTSLRNRVSPFTPTGSTMRGRNIRISVDTLDDLDIPQIQYISENPDNFDIMFIYGYPPTGFSVDEINQIKSYLDDGGNVILFNGIKEAISDIFDFTSNIDADKLQYYYDDISIAGFPVLGTSANEYGKGRTVWVQHYDSTSGNPAVAENDLLKSVIMWTSEDFPAIPGPVFTATLPNTFFKTFYTVSIVDNVFDMYKVSLTLWYIF